MARFVLGLKRRMFIVAAKRTVERMLPLIIFGDISQQIFIRL